MSQMQFLKSTVNLKIQLSIQPIPENQQQLCQSHCSWLLGGLPTLRGIERVVAPSSREPGGQWQTNLNWYIISPLIILHLSGHLSEDIKGQNDSFMKNVVFGGIYIFLFSQCILIHFFETSCFCYVIQTGLKNLKFLELYTYFPK